MFFFTRTMALVVVVVAALLGAGGLVALAQSAQSTQRAAGGNRATTAGPTPPPLPFGDASRGTQGSRRSNNVPGGSTDDSLRALSRLSFTQRGSSRLERYSGPRPPIPKLTDLLKHKVRWRHSASGGTIVLTGTSNTAYLDDQTLSYGAQVYWLCQNLTPNTQYQYVLFSPDGYAYTLRPRDYVNGGFTATSWFSTDAQGRCLQGGATTYPFYASEALATPLAASPDPLTAIGPANPKVAADPPYSGVWTVAMQNKLTSEFEAVAYSVVLGTLNFSTYTDAAHTIKSADFASGSTVYVTASGLNPAHFYAFGFVNTSGNGLPCIGTIPWNAQNNNNATCFVQGGTGVLPSGGVVSGQVTMPAAGANSAGTYSVQLFDVTTADLISTSQISLNPSTVTWNTLLPYNGATTGTNLNDTFATDGIINSMPGGAQAEQSVQGLTYQASGVTSGRVYRMTISNGNGVVMSGTTTDGNNFQGTPQSFSLPTQFTAASTSTGPQKLAFPLNLGLFTAFGATQTPFAPNVYTAQIFDVAANSVVGSKSFTILSYQGSFQWTAPPGAYVNVAAGGAATNVTTTFRNGAGVLYGNWNGDDIKAITITNDSGNLVSLGRQGGVTTTTDSSNQIWNITNPNAQTITLTPSVAGQSLPVNGTIPIPMTVAAAPGTCTSVCVLRTSITPLHGVAASNVNNTMTNTATNGLDVFGNGVIGTNTQASYSWKIGAYSAAQLGTPRYTQMMYRSGTNSAAGGSYTVTVTVVNNGSPKPLQNIEFVMPPTVDPNQKTPQLTSVIVAGVNQTAKYFIETQNGGNGAIADPARLTIPNAFGIVTNTAAAAVPIGQTATFTFTLPILLTAFPFQEVGATGNYYDSSGSIGGPSYPIGPTNALTNAVAGTANIDSTELAVFSLDPQLMSATLTPTVLPAQAGNSTIFKLVNTTTGLDPNPDYISQLLLTIPAGAIPNSITVTSPNQSGVTWNANPTGTAGQWLIDLCAVSTAPNPATQASTPCAGTTDLKSLPPGAELDVTLNYTTAPTLGSYKIGWTVVGANGGAVVAATAAQQPTLTIANTTAQTAFTYSGGYASAPSYPPAAPILAVPAGTEPIVGSWSDFNNGNAFVYELYNNGTTTITDVSVSIPSSNTSGKFGDPAGWKIMQPTIHVYGQGAAGGSCSNNGIKSLTQPVPGAPGTQGLLMLSGCNLLPNQRLDIFFDAQSPYDTTLATPVFAFNASVATGGAVPPDPRVAANINTLPSYSLSNTERIVVDAKLVIEVPSGAWPGSAYAPALYGGSTPSGIGCITCTFASGGAYPLINFNNIAGTVTANDALAATVYSDSANGWNLSVQTDLNPNTSSGQVSTWVSADSSVPGTGTYTRSVPNGPGTVIPVGSTLTLSSYTGAVRKQPVDNIMSYTVTVNPLSVNNNVTTTATLTYTLIAN